LRSHQATATSMRATVARSKPVGIRPIRGGLILDDGPNLQRGSDSARTDGPTWAADRLTWLKRRCRARREPGLAARCSLSSPLCAGADGRVWVEVAMAGNKQRACSLSPCVSLLRARARGSAGRPPLGTEPPGKAAARRPAQAHPPGRRARGRPARWGSEKRAEWAADPLFSRSTCARAPK
jgi:hypothetical protein